EPPKNINKDLSTNVLIVLTKTTGIKNIKAVAEDTINKILQKTNLLTDISFAPPIFINFNLSKNRLFSELESAVELQDEYPKLSDEEKFYTRKNILIEFVSANPTGPLHIGHGRSAVIGDTLSKIFALFGAEVQKEYYINNLGKQIELLGKSVELEARKIKGEKITLKEVSENLYRGEYIKNLAEDLMFETNGVIPDQKIIESFAVEKILQMIKTDLKDFRIEFDSWVYESKLLEDRTLETVMQKLQNDGVIYEQDNALWFKSEEIFDEKDRVIKKSDGSWTYFGTDIAYHWYKFKRGFNKLINIWGADHHGYSPRLLSAIKSLGYDESVVNILIYQLVSLLRAGSKIKMSTRAGEFVTLREVIDEIGVDATRYFLSTKSPDAHLSFDLELAKKESSENPVYYIQYAHTRCCGILRRCSLSLSDEQQVVEAGKHTTQASPGLSGRLLQLLTESQEHQLMKKILLYPEMLYLCARNLTPHYLSNYLLDLATIFHKYYETTRVILDDIELTKARLYLIKGIKTVLRNGLALLGITAPERM
ncbi:MAG: arginine--tRNA ligase, partial [Elusimicrobiota bacterium]|nr:arginine--tRNA ligase [Elusimicrobiota bacterium]